MWWWVTSIQHGGGDQGLILRRELGSELPTPSIRNFSDRCRIQGELSGAGSNLISNYAIFFYKKWAESYGLNTYPYPTF
jgi:hypothetical protein